MNTLDPIMTDILMGLYLGLTTLLLINIFIALLTSTFNRVHDSSKAYFLLQRAMEILQIENMLTNARLHRHYRSLQREFTDDHFTFNMNKQNMMDKLEPVRESLNTIRSEIDELNTNLEDMEKNLVI